MSNQTEHTHPSILVVDDDRLILSTIAAGLESAGYTVSTAESVDEAEAWLADNPAPDLVLLDYSMPEINGIALAPTLKSLNVPFIQLTAYSDQGTMDEVIKAGAMSYLVKPMNLSQIKPAIETALNRGKDLNHLQHNNSMLQTALDGDRAVSVAVGILVERHHLSHDEAFESLRRYARSGHMKLMDLAKNIIDAAHTLDVIVNTPKVKVQTVKQKARY